jgi:hypothetical protein
LPYTCHGPLAKKIIILWKVMVQRQNIE